MLMFHRSNRDSQSEHETLHSRGYWPTLAGRYLQEGKYSKAVETCKEYLAEAPELLSGRLIYARALYHAGQIDSAAEQFYYVLALDPDNLAALKYLGDIQYAAGQEVAAMASYQRVLELDPRNNEIVWEYKAPGFFGASLAGQSRMPNGNTVICEGGRRGRLFEVTPEGEIVWEYLTPFFDGAGRRHAIYRCVRYPAEYIDNILAQNKQ